MDHRRAIVAIKVVHSIIFLINSVAVVQVFLRGVFGLRLPGTKLALIAALGEVVIFLTNRGRCPLTILVEDLGASDGRVSDIFLPRVLADHIPHVCGPMLAAGLIGLIGRERGWFFGR